MRHWIGNGDRMRRTLVGICMMLTVICVSIYLPPSIVYAYTSAAGTVIDGPVKVRSAPVSGEKVALITAGTAVTVTDESQGADGYVWYQIQVNISGKMVTGYIRSDFIMIAAEASADEQYVAGLKAAGFPDSYCPALLELHKKYPQWQFVPVQTNLDWNTAVEKESTTGKNLIQSAVNDARKSTDWTAYNWETNTWYGFDGAGWVSASKEYIAYCMDPRNFLNETYIFQFETLEYSDYQNVTGVNNILANTFMAQNYTDTDGVTRSYADTFMEIGMNLKVSPYHLAARCKQEQGMKGTSPLISGKYKAYEGYYNYFNVRAFETSSASATVNGLAYAKQQGWNSIYHAIAGGSEVVANNYVKKGQNTIYFEKFNVVYTKSLYSHQYMTNLQAAMSEGSIMGKAYADKQQAFVFRIPVYNNMPQTAVTFADQGNPNNWLSELSVNGCSLTPVFSGANTVYSLVVDASVSTVEVKAVPVANTSQVSGTGTYDLNYGNNTVQVNCISQSGEPRTYTITIARAQGDGTQTSDAGEGNILYGDINGDGKVSNLDLVLMQKHILGITELTGSSLEAANVSRDGGISNKDLVILQKHILGIEQIEQ